MSPAFPAEIFETIVDQAGRNDDPCSRSHTLASLALVSWSLRHLAHGRLFSEINILGTHQRSATPRLRRLQQLINTDPKSRDTGIASYVRSFTVRMVGIPRMVRPTLDDGSLADIMRKIYQTETVGPRVFSLTLGILGNLRNQVFDWTSLNQDFQSAFYDLCRNPMLTTLELAFFINVPRELLRHSVVKNIKFSDIRLVALPEDPDADLKGNIEEIVPKVVEKACQLDALEKGHGILLQAIDTDHSISLLDILDMTPARIISPKLIFSKLKSLNSRISSEGDLRQTMTILADTTQSLETLGLRLSFNGELSLPTNPKIESNQLSALKKLSVDQTYRASYKSPGTSTIPQICNVIGLLKLPPTLSTIEISIFLYTGLSERTPSDIFDGHDFSPLDELFCHGRFYALRNLCIRFVFNRRLDGKEVWDERSFQDSSAVYARNKFPELNTVVKAGNPLDFEITIVPLVRLK